MRSSGSTLAKFPVCTWRCWLCLVVLVSPLLVIGVLEAYQQALFSEWLYHSRGQAGQHGRDSIQRAWHGALKIDPPRQRQLPQSTKRPSRHTTVLLTMDCSHYSNWQSVIAIGSLDKLRQAAPPGSPERNFSIVRLMSCADGESSMSDDVRDLGDETYFSQPLGDPYPYAPVKGFVYPPLNKPFAVSQWLFHGAGRRLADDEEVVVVDTDFLFLRPLSFGASALGRPAASSTYRLGSRWLTHQASSEVRRFCPDNRCDRYANQKTMDESFDVGAPYYLRAADLRAIVPWWLNITETIVRASDPQKAWSMPGGWICEMYAYVMAAMVVDRPHRLLADQMAYVPGHLTTLPEQVDYPVALHFCQVYNLTAVWPGYRLYFNKHDWHDRASRVMLSCDPEVSNGFLKAKGYRVPDLFHQDRPPPVDRSATAQGRTNREVWFLWNIHKHFPIYFEKWRSTHCK